MHFSDLKVKQFAKLSTQNSVLSTHRLSLITATGLTTIVVVLCAHLALANFDKRSIGEDIFRNRCAVCHGLDGSGDTTLGKKLKIPDLRSEKVQRLTDDDLIKVVTDGMGEMPSFKKKLSRDSIYQVIGHIRKLKQD